MPRRRKRRHVDSGKVDALLSGAQPIDLAGLLELIRNVNPSRLELTPPERQQRYRLKGRLQSELLRRFAGELELFPAAPPGVFGIRRKGTRGDACHAVIAQLDPDVRQIAIDALAQHGSSAVPGTRTPGRRRR